MASPVEPTRAHVWRYLAVMLENCIPPVTATGRSVVMLSPCVRDGQTGVERERERESVRKLLIQHHLA